MLWPHGWNGLHGQLWVESITTLMQIADSSSTVIQALHIACLDRPEPGEPFPVASNTLFNATPIATPQPSSSAAPKPGRPANLALIISLPVVFGVLVIAGIIACCFYSARHRRRIMAQRNAMRRIQDKSSPTFPSQHHEYYQQQYSQSQGFESVAAAEPNYFSPVSDHKENPYIQFHQPQPQQQEQPPPTHQPHQSQQQYPQYRSYTPADYASPITATTSPIPSFPLDTSQIGPGPNQKQIHTLHDQYFPPPPPPTNLLMQPQPPQFQFTPLTSASMSMPPQAPPIPTQAGIGGGVESLRQHQMKIPSLGMPDPSRRKKSLEAQRAQQSQSQSQRPSQEEIPLTDYRARDGGEGRVGEVEASESPQVFVFDEVEGRYVKERSPTG